MNTQYGEITPLRRLCMNHGLSRNGLAVKANIAPRTLYAIDSGQIPSPQTIQKLAQALGMERSEVVAALYPESGRVAA